MRVMLTSLLILLTPLSASAVPLDNVSPPPPRPDYVCTSSCNGGASSTAGSPFASALQAIRNLITRGAHVTPGMEVVTNPNGSHRLNGITYGTNGMAIAGRTPTGTTWRQVNANYAASVGRDGTYHNGGFDE